jgi:hypothetical protein
VGANASGTCTISDIRDQGLARAVDHASVLVFRHSRRALPTGARGQEGSGKALGSESELRGARASKEKR